MCVRLMGHISFPAAGTHIVDSPACHPTFPQVFIHGGSYDSGGVSIPIYNGELMASSGSVVVVTVQYRLGVFG